MALTKIKNKPNEKVKTGNPRNSGNHALHKENPVSNCSSGSKSCVLIFCILYN